MKIVRLEKSDIKPALELVWTVFQEFDAPDYLQQGIEEFRKFITYHTMIEKFDKGELSFWGCFEQNELTGIIATIAMTHICLLFVKKEFHRRGIARKLFLSVLNESTLQNVKRITVNSSPYAVDFYHRLGFVDTDVEQTVKGIRFTPMMFKI
ncbi:GNAT family N-acetyltransferase [Bacillus sp. JJ1764]|uniref:GNAT family N-acetyltransferase n=1 Tax=Bacillus sp. JJ1764 TaxID=3122964 RepID=UPI0030007C66